MNRIANAAAARLATTTMSCTPSTRPVAQQSRAPIAAKRPNIVVILVNDLGWPDVSLYGRSTVPTPSLARLSRAALLTGRMPQRFGFQYNLDDSVNHDQGLPLDQTTLADLLRAQRYRTAPIGKWHQGYTSAFYPMKRGFDFFYGFLAGETLYSDPGTPGIVPTPTKRDKNYARKDGWNAVTGPDARPVANHGKYLTDDFTDHAVSFIDQSADGKDPFLLYLAYNAPHWPLQVTQQWYDRFAKIKDPVRRTYVAMIAAMDAGVGRVLNTLEAKGIRKDTMIIFLSDNGCPIQFGVCDCSHPLGAGKLSYVEGGTRVPFIVSWPAVIKRHGTVDTPVSSLDIVPTALRAAASDEPLPSGLDGRDLLGRQPGRALLWGQSPVWAARKGLWKLWHSQDRKMTQLFDLSHDPAELTDLAGANPAVVNRLSARLTSLRQSLPPPKWPVHLVKEARMCAKETQWVY